MTDRSPYGQFRARAIKLPAWQIAIIGALAAALLITLAVVATGVFLLVFPAMILLDWVYRWKTKGTRPATPPRQQRGKVISAEYEVIPPDAANEERR